MAALRSDRSCTPGRQRRLARAIALCGAMALGAAGPAAAQITRYEHTELSSAFPPGGRRGTQVTVTFRGRPMAGFRGVRVSGTGVTVRSIEGKSQNTAQAVLEIAPDAPLGRRNIRVVTRGGVSDPCWFIVGQYPELVEQEPNHTASPGEPSGRPLALPVVVNGRLDEGADIDRFRFRARAGESVTLAVEGQSLDSQRGNRGYLDTTLTVYDERGQVVARNEDFHTLDPFLVFRPERDGEYMAEVREVSFSGGDTAVYRLTIGAVPWATSLYPAGGRRGERVAVTVGGPLFPDGGKATIQVPADAGDLMEVSPSKDAANTRPFLVDDLPEVLEAEPNDRPEQANAVTLPAVYNGRLERLGDVDAFRVRLRAGESISVDVLAGRVLRSPVDMAVTILDARGKQVAQNDDGPHTLEVSNNRVESITGDPRVEFKAPAEGDYTVVVRDVAGRGAPDCVYRATVEPLQQRFTLYSFYDNPVIMGPGATGAVPVQILRYGGFDGAVRLRVEGLPPGYKGGEAIMPPGLLPPQRDVFGPPSTVTITAPPDAAVGTMFPFRIVGEAEIDGKRVVVQATPMGHLGQAGDHAIRRRTDTYLACVVEPIDFHLRTDTRAISGAPGELVRIPVTIERLPGFEGMTPLLPLRGAGKFHQVATFTPPQNVVEEGGKLFFPFTIPRDTKPGEYTFVLCRPLAGDFRGNVITVSTLPIRVTVTPAPRAPAGGTDREGAAREDRADR